MKYPLRLLSAVLSFALAWLLMQSALAQGRPAPNDPRYGDQWALDRIGAPCAWLSSTGNRNVTVAVVDTGVDLAHPDLAGRLRTDGYDFVDDDPLPNDENGHGTHVSGIIAATLDNAAGIAGLAPDARILPVRVMDREGSGSDETIARGIRYATRKQARVINLSLGMTLWLSDFGARSPTGSLVSVAVREAQDAGALVVVAAGNDFVPLPNVIAYDNPDVLLVAASNEDEARAPFSNSGPWVDVVAPGQHILSTMPTYEVYLTSDDLPPQQRFKQDYDYMSGTSQATPYVSALAALLFATYPDAQAADVQAVIKQFADGGIYDQHPPEYRRLWELGAGRIDACATLRGAAAEEPAP